MSFLSRWHSDLAYESQLWLHSEQFPGVRFRIKKVSLSQRLELSARIRELTLKNEFLRAGELTDELEADMADLMVQRLYLEWAVTDIQGLRIDGNAATVSKLIESGPEALVNEMAHAIGQSLELSETARKNS